MVSDPSPDVILDPVTGDPRPLADWLTMFHLALVIVDPFTHESAWILQTARRVLTTFSPADVRNGFLVTGTADQARVFLGPITDEFIVFADPDRALVRSLDLERLPAWVHINHLGGVERAIEGWDPDAWREAAEHLAERMSWSRPMIPALGDPVAYVGSPAMG